MINEHSKERVFVRRYRIIVLNAISEKFTQRKSFCLGELRTVPSNIVSLVLLRMHTVL